LLPLRWKAAIAEPGMKDKARKPTTSPGSEPPPAGMTILPSYVGEPECNGVIERFMRTLKEQCLHLHQFQTLAEAQRLIAEFITRCNAGWSSSGSAIGRLRPPLGPRHWRRSDDHAENAIAQWRQDQRSARGSYPEIPRWCPETG